MFDSGMSDDQVFLIQHTMTDFVRSSIGMHNIIFGITEHNNGLFSKYVFNDNDYIDTLTMIHDFKLESDFNPAKIYEVVKEDVIKFIRNNGFDGRNELTIEQGIAIFKDMNKLVHELIDDYRAMNWKLETPIFGNQFSEKKFKNLKDPIDNGILF